MYHYVRITDQAEMSLIPSLLQSPNLHPKLCADHLYTTPASLKTHTKHVVDPGYFI
jgi:hypothetical protein